MSTRRDFIKGSLAGTAFLGLAGAPTLGEQGGSKMAKKAKGDISHRLFFFEEKGPARPTRP